MEAVLAPVLAGHSGPLVAVVLAPSPSATGIPAGQRVPVGAAGIRTPVGAAGTRTLVGAAGTRTPVGAAGGTRTSVGVATGGTARRSARECEWVHYRCCAEGVERGGRGAPGCPAIGGGSPCSDTPGSGPIV